MKRNWALILVAFLFLVSCTPKVPKRYIQPDELEDILVEYHLAKSLASHDDDANESADVLQLLYMKAVLQKYGYTQADFDSSMVYYYTNAERFEDIYERVAERLENQALVLGATEGEMGQYASLDNNGDTANVWTERRTLSLMPVAPYDKWTFTINGDTTYRNGDRFLMRFMSDYVFQDGSKNTVLYVAVTYDNDTTITRNIHFSSSGLTQLHIPEYEKANVKQIRGFFYLKGDKDRSTTTRLLFIDNIQLVRFHKERLEINDEIEKDSLSSDSL